MTEGILYMAAGEQYVEEARKSAKSAKAHMPDIETAIATPDTDLDLSVFDRVIERESRTKVIDGRKWLIDSTIPPELSPFDKTLFLDSDTYVCADVRELFDLLDRFDMAIARNPFKNDIDGLPAPWWEYNCGVIAYADTPEMRSFLEEWEARYLERIETQSEPEDQPAFMHTLYNNEVDFFTLPQEYNVRCDRRGALGREAKIVHGRHQVSIEKVAEEINNMKYLRVFRQNSYLGTPVLTVDGHEAYRYHIEKIFVEEGIKMILKRGGAHIIDRIFGTNLVDQTYASQNTE